MSDDALEPRVRLLEQQVADLRIAVRELVAALRLSQRVAETGHALTVKEHLLNVQLLDEQRRDREQIAALEALNDELCLRADVEQACGGPSSSLPRRASTYES